MDMSMTDYWMRQAITSRESLLARDDKIDRLEGEICRLTKELDRLKTSKKDEFAGLRKECEELAAENEEVVKEVKKLRSKNLSQQLFVNRMAEESDKRRLELHSAIKSCEHKDRMIGQLSKRVETNDMRSWLARTTGMWFQDRARKLDVERNGLIKEISNNYEDIESLKATIKEKVAEISRLSGENRELKEADCGFAGLRLAALKSVVNSMEVESGQLQLEIRELKHQLSEKERVHANELATIRDQKKIADVANRENLKKAERYDKIRRLMYGANEFRLDSSQKIMQIFLPFSTHKKYLSFDQRSSLEDALDEVILCSAQ